MPGLDAGPMTTTQHHHRPAGPSTGTAPAPVPTWARRRAPQILVALVAAALLVVAAIWVTGSTSSEPASPMPVAVVQPDLDDPATRQELVDRFEPGSFGLRD
jgi:hypothetical protein